MQDRISKLKQHYIICGIGRVGANVAHELLVTDRAFVAIEDAQTVVASFHEKYPKTLVLHGDSSDDEILQHAGIERAAGLFAVTGDDSKNLLITLTAKQLNPGLRVVARCHEVRTIEKLKRVGADAIVSPDFTGGMRIPRAWCDRAWSPSLTRCCARTTACASRKCISRRASRGARSANS